MGAPEILATTRVWSLEKDRMEALEQCRLMLAREGFTVSWIVSHSTKRDARPPDLLASKGARLVRVFVLKEGEVDSAESRVGIRNAVRLGETRLCVPWPLRWRAISNLERWGLGGVSVSGL